MISKLTAHKNKTVIPPYSYVIPAKAGISSQQKKKTKNKDKTQPAQIAIIQK